MIPTFIKSYTPHFKQLPLPVCIRALSVLAAIAPLPSMAQSANRPVMELETIVVTARKREENLQDVPMAISAFSSENLERRDITDLEGIAEYTAGLNYEDFATSFNGLVTIRGLVQANIQNRVTNVAVFVDGLHIPRNYALDLGLTEFERVEVVKGPQSALYGQNAFAGAINYVVAKPNLNEVEANFTGTLGLDERYDGKVSFNAPLIDDVLAVRGFYGYSEYAGNRDNDFPNVSKKYEKLGGYERDTYSIGVAYQPTDDLSFDFYYQDSHKEEEMRASYTVSGTNSSVRLNCGPSLPGTTDRPSFYCGELPSSASSFQTAGSTRPNGILVPDQPGSTIDSKIYRSTVNYDINDEMQVNYVYGRVEAEAYEVTSMVDDPTQGFNTFQKEGGINTFESHEVRLSYMPDGPLDVEVGYYHSKNEDDFVFGLGFYVGSPDLVITNPTTGILDLSGMALPFNNYSAVDTTDAIFTSLKYHFLDEKATLSLDLRYGWEESSMVDNLAGGLKQSDDFANFTPRVTLEYQVTDDSLLYTSVAKGIKAGGFNGFVSGSATLTAEESTFDEEENWTYEVGVKNILMDGRLILNTSAYFIDWSGMQITTVPSAFDITAISSPSDVAPTIYQNVGDVENWGLEAEGMFRISEDWSLEYSLSYSDPKFKDGTKWGQFAGVCDDVFCPADGDVSGNTLPRQSKFQSALGIQYEHDLSNGLTVFARTDYTYASKQYADALNLAYTPGRELVNASVGLQADNWKVTLWGKNLLDETYTTNSLYIVQFRRYTPSLNDGFTAGVTLSVNF